MSWSSGICRAATWLVVLAAWLSCVATWVVAGDDEAGAFFEDEVRPLLAERCWKCHGEERQRGDLRLDSLGGMLAGGASGPAIVPGNASESLLIDAINYATFEMPPTGQLLPKEIEVLTRWIEQGAFWPGYDQTTQRSARMTEKITAEDRAFWSYQPVKLVEPPELAGDSWSRNEIDRFILRKLHAEDLAPAVEADRRRLIRRATFDLTGLPPTEVEVADFVADASPDAYERVIDRLLESPRYGERWARHWLDLVRYAESDGWRQDAYRPQAWRYRDYVIAALNTDKPYDRFVIEQLAGDEVAPDDPSALAATGFLRHGTYEYNQRDVRTQWMQMVDEVTDVTADVFLGMGYGCARCHDHKFDPILQRDYYRLRAFFAAMLPRDDVSLATPQEREAYAAALAEWEDRTAELREAIEKIEAPLRLKAEQRAVEKFPPDIQAMLRATPAERDPLEHQLAELAYRQVTFEFDRMTIPKDQQPQLNELREKLRAYESLRPRDLPAGMTVCDMPHGAAKSIVPAGMREEVEPGFPEVLEGGGPAEIAPLSTAPASTGRRATLARWIAKREHPLTARVLVNRVWQHHFGQGLVRTPSDFGRLGEPPTHPELLDWLATYFVEQGWRWKPLHRLMMTSATYRQTALRESPDAARLNDPENRWWWRMPIRRLDAEQIRDAALAASGELDWKAGGPSVDAASQRRSIYLKVLRNQREPLLDVFDTADGLNSTPQRNVTTTAPQALFMMNGGWMRERAKAVAKRIEAEGATDDAARVQRAFEQLQGRRPQDDERDEAVAFLGEQAKRVRNHSPQWKAPWEPFSDGKRGAARLRGEGAHEKLHLSSHADLPIGDFTIEAVFVLDSLYEDAAVRTIASQWSGDEKQPGWSLGVTSTRSRFEPRNLILQLVGQTVEDRLEYLVLPSNLRVALGQAHYAAAVVRMARDGKPGGVEFFLQELDESPVMQQAVVPHGIVGGYSSGLRLTLGGRDSPRRGGWDGLLDEVRLSQGAIDVGHLLVGSLSDAANVVGHWRFETADTFYADESNANDLESLAPGDVQSAARSIALVDLCHVLLNSNEFLYVE